MKEVLKISANDHYFFTPRSRNTPIKATLQSIDGLPKKLKIFRILGSKYWQLRYFHNGEYLIKSLKTTDILEAKQLADSIYRNLFEIDELRESTNRNSDEQNTNNQYQLHDLITEILIAERERLKRDEIVRGSYVMTQIRLEGEIFSFFKDKPLKKINSKVLTDFVNYLTSKKMTVSTIQGYIANVRKLLKLLCDKEIISSIPQFPKLKNQINSRGAFTITEYKLILRMSKVLRKIKYSNWGSAKKPWINKEYHHMPFEMNWLIRFMIYTFVRPGDIRQIKNRHIEIIDGSYKYLRLNLPEIKRHNASTVSLPPAVGIYKRVLDYQVARGYGKPDDYVFFPEVKDRKFLLGILGWAFNWIMHELGIKNGPHGVERSLYSLRHSSITFRLIFGGNIDLLTLARNARTSVEMIEKFYASTLSSEMNIALIHNKRR